MINADRDLLLRLLELPTAGPLETPADSFLWEAMDTYAEAAAETGLSAIHFAAADPSVLTAVGVPEKIRTQSPDFLACQPSLVLRLGPAEPAVMFNVHLDTVAPFEQAGFDGTRFRGRGAIDAKGPAVALLAGIRAAVAAEPAVGRDTGVVVQAVSGEEGGAMGVFGTRPLVEAGFHGRLNVFCEPTGLRYLPRSSAAMTAAVRVDGEDAVDDEPHRGHNATVLLGFLAQHLAMELVAPSGQPCVAGVHTGRMHNRVYGQGELLLNLPYDCMEAERRTRVAVERGLRSGLAEFNARFAEREPFRRTAAEATTITSLRWDKRGLPALPPQEIPLLDEIAPRWPDDEPGFTCDAIWLADIPDTRTAVLGPGLLGANHAHAAGEFAEVAELDRFGELVREILVRFARTGDWGDRER